MTAPAPLDAYDAQLLELLRGSFSLVQRPFEVIAGTLGGEEDEVIADTRRLLADGHFEKIAPVFPARAFGLHPTLAAARVPADALWVAERVVAQHPGVSHIRIRDDAFNLWFTIAVDPGSVLGLAGTLRILERLGQAREICALSLRHIFVGEPPSDWRDALSERAAGEDAPAAPAADATDRAVAQATQDGLDIGVEPFAAAARRLGSNQEDLLLRLRSMRASKLLLRVGAIGGRPSSAMHRATAQAVWKVPDARLIGDRLRGEPSVVFAAERQTHRDWPFNLYVTVAGDDADACAETLDRLEREAAPEDSRRLRTLASKKIRRRLFAPEEHQAWEEIHARPHPDPAPTGLGDR